MLVLTGANYPACRAGAHGGWLTIEAVADLGYYSGEEIVACEQAGITVDLPLLAKVRFGKQDFVYVTAHDVYLAPPASS
jgi:hypothetical protein